MKKNVVVNIKMTKEEAMEMKAAFHAFIGDAMRMALPNIEKEQAEKIFLEGFKAGVEHFHHGVTCEDFEGTPENLANKVLALSLFCIENESEAIEKQENIFLNNNFLYN